MVAQSMIERVAGALLTQMLSGQEDWRGRNRPDKQLDDLPLDWQEVYREYARAAIEAMREPTSAMLDAGGSFLETAWDHWHTDDQRAKTAFGLMIDAALHDAPVPA